MLLLLGALFFWAYWPTFGEIAERWSTPIYSHGYLVPLFAAFLLWQRREYLHGAACTPSWWSLLFLALGAALHLAGARFYVDFASALSLPFALMGIALALGGGAAFRWSWPALAFLVFMLPLPFRVETSLALPLQRTATLATTYLLQTLGFAAVSEGNVILLEESRIGVVEACNGLGMLMTFFAISTGFAILMRGPLWERFVILASAIPIALFANVIRITLSAIATETMGRGAGEFVHDWGGLLLMMPLAVCLLWAEQWLLHRLLIEVREDEPLLDFTGVPPNSVPQTREPQTREQCAV